MLSSPPPTSVSKSGDLSATALVPGTTTTTNGHHTPGHHGPHHHGEISASSLAVGITPIEVTVSASPAPSPASITTTVASSQPVPTAISTYDERLCVACQQTIRDRYLMCVGEHYWHEHCLQCTVCRIILTNSCYVKERKVYCKSDYRKLFPMKCQNCLETIGDDELVMRVNGHIYHETCFVCFACHRLLRKGDRFVLHHGKLYCEADMLERHRMIYGTDGLHNSATSMQQYETQAAAMAAAAANGAGGLQSQMSPSIDTQLSMLQQPHTPMDGQDPYSPNGGMCDPPPTTTGGQAKSEPYSPPSSMASCNSGQLIGHPNGPPSIQQCNAGAPPPPPPPVKQDGRRGPKRPRTILTTAQRRAFKASFEISQKPCRKVRETLAKETGLSVRIVQVWFQNQRAKLKKIQRKQQQQQMVQGGGMLLGTGSESGGGIGSSDKSKDDTTDDEDDESTRFSHSYMSPDPGSYYSMRGDDNGYSVKSELCALEDSETSLCELDDGLRDSSEHHTVPSGDSFPNPPHPMMGHEMMLHPPPPQSTLNMFSPPPPPPPPPPTHPPIAHLHSLHHNSTVPSMTPIDKLYSMQNSYFSNPSEIEC